MYYFSRVTVFQVSNQVKEWISASFCDSGIKEVFTKWPGKPGNIREIICLNQDLTW